MKSLWAGRELASKDTELFTSSIYFHSFCGTHDGNPREYYRENDMLTDRTTRMPANRQFDDSEVEGVVYDCCVAHSMADDDFLFEEPARAAGSAVTLDAGIESLTGTEDRDFDLT